ncbi:MAG: pyridoxal phosphate-dependent aminotransferase [Prevotellaceae bacterium]|jgi:cystathionine beta-lyase|nr:pyridoxal phosphate-dependent aminotransferase [Prevotellaceae bacterium]
MIYDFDEIIPRRGTFSSKWDRAGDGVLPMWVADMDFRTAPPVTEALMRRVRHGIFGYSLLPDEYYDAVIGWFGRRYGFDVKREWILSAISVVPAVSAILRALTVPGDKVMIQSPVYNCFYSVISANGCEAVSNDLIYENGGYTVDFDDLERIASAPDVKVMLLCSPHNPAGRVWTREELTRTGEICIRHGVTVLSDEIHCDLVFGQYRHLPFASLGEHFLLHSVTCTSPSKTFNLAGLHASNIFVANPNLRKRIQQALDANGIGENNSFAADSLIAAYNEGEEWLEQLLAYLYDNYLYLKEYLAEHFPQLHVLPLQATYLAWVDCKALQVPSASLSRMLVEKGKVWFNAGTMYGANGEGFLRINIACPRTLLKEGLERMRKTLKVESRKSKVESRKLKVES